MLSPVSVCQSTTNQIHFPAGERKFFQRDPSEISQTSWSRNTRTGKDDFYMSESPTISKHTAWISIIPNEPKSCNGMILVCTVFVNWLIISASGQSAAAGRPVRQQRGEERDPKGEKLPVERESVDDCYTTLLHQSCCAEVLCYDLQELRLVCQTGMNTVKKLGSYVDKRYLKLLRYCTVLHSRGSQ